MANAVKGEVSFEANGETFTLIFDFNALCELEEEFGVDAGQLGDAIGQKMGNLRKVFRIGLARHHSLNDEEAGDVISGVGPQRAGELVGQAFNAAFPSAEGANGSARPRKARAGSTT